MHTHAHTHAHTGTNVHIRTLDTKHTVTDVTKISLFPDNVMTDYVQKYIL